MDGAMQYITTLYKLDSKGGGGGGSKPHPRWPIRSDISLCLFFSFLILKYIHREKQVRGWGS
jgi:hypothetical protein